MKGTSKFQIIFISIFIAALVFAFLVFSDIIPLGKSKSAQTGGTGSVVIWGTLPFTQIAGSIQTLTKTAKSFGVVYVEKQPGAFEQELLEKLASGTGPDMIIYPEFMLLRMIDKIYAFPYESYPQAKFQSDFVTEGNLLLGQKGILGLPLLIDPLVMFYNQDLFDSANIPIPPTTWTEIATTTVPSLTTHEAGDASKIVSSGIALGSFSNINNAKDIIMTLLLQLGIDPVVPVATGGFQSPLGIGGTLAGADAAVDFYTSFSNPAKTNYSWNRSLKSSRDMFISGDLAIYIGYGSEIAGITKANPNLRFTVAKLPQREQAKSSVTMGRLYSVSILKNSKNLNTAFIAAGLMSQPQFVGDISKALVMPPARRDLLSKKPAGAAEQVFYESALVARGWRDPNSAETTTAIRTMVDSVLRGEKNSRSAVLTFGDRLNRLLQAVPVVQ